MESKDFSLNTVPIVGVIGILYFMELGQIEKKPARKTPS